MSQFKNITISCVLDASPAFTVQCQNWIFSLKSVNAFERANILVHHTPNVDSETLKRIESLDVKLVPVEPFGEGSALYCNKLRQLETDAILNSEYVILCDTDILFMKCPTRLAKGSNIRAKIVDLPNPPEHIWRAIVEKSGIVNDFSTEPTDFSPSDITLSTNFNGGLYMLPSLAVQKLKSSWPRWSNFCLENVDLLDRWHHHSDQLGFALALLETSLPFQTLGVSENFPTHFPADQYTDINEQPLAAIHYHSNVDSCGLPQKIGVTWVDQQIDQAVQQIRDDRSTSHSNEILHTDEVKQGVKMDNQHDISQRDLDWALSESPTPKLLLELVRLSREKLSFFPQTIIRSIEYPWFAHRMKSVAGLHVLDVGAGVNVLPFWLANIGANMTTIDLHSMIRNPTDKSGWNEWGFLDYSLLEEKITSFNMDMNDYEPALVFDIIYSVSVIEHMPAIERRKIITKMANCLKTGGKILLSIDLIPKTDELWLLSEEVIVDPTAPHGSLQDVLNELENNGLTIIECTTSRNIPNSRTDVSFIEVQK